MNVEVKGFNKVIIKLDDLSDNLAKKADDLSKKCAEFGKEEAELLYSRSVKDGEDDGSFDVEKRSDGCWSFNANGREPIFVEFGAGVYYNGVGNYPIQKPKEIKGIGEYGHGKGKQDKWVYVDSDDNKHWTYGTRSQKPMYNALRHLMNNIKNIAEEVFK